MNCPKLILAILGIALFSSCGEVAGMASFSSSSEGASSSSSEAEISSSSSAEVPSSSSTEASSSSSTEASSSSSEYVSSSSEELSSSSVETDDYSSSSSEELSSSSSEAEISSNSSTEVSSSSSAEVSSSSSAEVSSSSSAEVSSSSSLVPCTANNNTSTYYCLNGVLTAYGFVTHGGQSYRTVVIGSTAGTASKLAKAIGTQAEVAVGTQTWMADNLNYNVTGSRCYSNSNANCNKYGRLYDWATAMNLPSSCNSNSCVKQIQSKHQGICPYGWHIPSNDDWNTLMNYIGASSSAGKSLKAKSGWNNNGNNSGNGTDLYGFSALPGGYGHALGTSENAGSLGRWWSTRDDGSDKAYVRSMHYDRDNVLTQGYEKSILYSVRCVKD